MTIQSQPQTKHDLRLAARQGLLPADGSGWLAGFGNIFGKEMSEWFHTRRWLWQILLWVTIVNGFVAFILFVIPALEATFPGIGASMDASMSALPRIARSLMYYFALAMMGGSIGVIILAQDEVILEKQTGTTSWILSKPVTRPAFILSKVLSNTIGALIFIVALPGLITVIETRLGLQLSVPLVPFLLGAGVLLLGLFFYISLVIFLGVLFDTRGPVLGIAFGIMFGGSILANFIPQIAYVLPVTMDKVALVLAVGMPMPVMFTSQLIAAAVLSIGFVLTALWRFQRVEF